MPYHPPNHYNTTRFLTLGFKHAARTSLTSPTLTTINTEITPYFNHANRVRKFSQPEENPSFFVILKTRLKNTPDIASQVSGAQSDCQTRSQKQINQDALSYFLPSVHITSLLSKILNYACHPPFYSCCTSALDSTTALPPPCLRGNHITPSYHNSVPYAANPENRYLSISLPVCIVPRSYIYVIYTVAYKS